MFDDRYFMASNELNLLNTLLLSETAKLGQSSENLAGCMRLHALMRRTLELAQPIRQLFCDSWLSES